MVAVTDTFIFANNASAMLNSQVNPGDVSIVLASGQGALFPSPSAGQYFAVTIQNVQTGLLEVCYCTGRSGDLLTVERAKEGTVQGTFGVANSVVQARITKGVLDKIIQRRFTGSDAGKYLKVLSSGEVIPDIPSLDDGTSPGNNYVFGTSGTGVKGWLQFPYALHGAAFVSAAPLTLQVAPVSLFFRRGGNLRRVVVLGDVAGNVTIDLRKEPLSTFTGTGTSICNGDFPTLVAQQYSDKTTFAPGFNTAISADEVLNVYITSVSLLRRVLVYMYFEESF